MTAEIYLCGNDSNVNSRHGNDSDVDSRHRNDSRHGNYNAHATNDNIDINDDKEEVQNSRLNFSSVLRWNISVVLPPFE